MSNEIGDSWKILEIPIDYEPWYLFYQEPYDVWTLVEKMKKFSHVILYHGTSSVYRESIEMGGIQPRVCHNNSNWSDKDESLSDSIYFWQLNWFWNVFNNVKTHAVRTAKKTGWKPIVIRCVLAISDLLADEDLKKLDSSAWTESIIKWWVARKRGIYKWPTDIFAFPNNVLESNMYLRSFKLDSFS